jgi:hypothetical protein
MWKATKKLTEITERSSEHIPAVERARLFVEIAETPDVAVPGVNTINVTATIQIYNEGKTPALLTDIFIAIRTLTHYPEGGDGYMTKTETDSGSIYVRAGIRETITKSTTITNITQEYNLIRENKAMLLCYGRIRYEDVLGDKWERWFCGQCKPSTVTTQWFFRMSPEGNYEKKYT